ncbi:Cthe_2314 family HEPN domain-containing protein [Lachnoclostridium phytofermentans]|uniref:Cthe_2314 family HEPN domain-containing protein n=1 Tax=Lachnoclostridium phytofermentans TaxID=66219 RepID=UPI0004976A0A|nr:Cthe_2314 family HEPN domain-containing protein [Lachnoclostridium phytofermentans]
MKMQDCLEQLENMESLFSNLINTKLGGYNDMDRIIAARIIDDTVDLVKDITRDVYMFNISYDNYNNGISFMPQYYFENILLHDDMIWERIIIIISIAYQIDFEFIFKRKSISSLYDVVKKDTRIESNIKKLLLDINSDSNMRALKITRNGNEHYMSVHLTENEKLKTDLSDIISIKDAILRGDIQKINENTDFINREEMKILKNKIPVVLDKQSKYVALLNLCIIQMESAFKNNNFTFNDKAYFIPVKKKFLHVDKNIWVKCDKLENYYSQLREEFREVVDMINENIFPAMSKSSFIRNTLLTDSLFRAKEVLRSINLYFGCMQYCISEKNSLPIDEIEKTEKFICNDVIFPQYYYDHAIIKLYSVYEKLAKFLLCKYDFKQEYLDDDKFKGMYIEKVVDLFKSKSITSSILIKFNDCISSTEYNDYEKDRNKEYHCLRSYYLLNEEGRATFAESNIYNVEKMMYSLYNVFSLIIKEEKSIYSEMILSFRDKQNKKQ